jgi:hypothetical protein
MCGLPGHPVSLQPHPLAYPVSMETMILVGSFQRPGFSCWGKLPKDLLPSEFPNLSKARPPFLARRDTSDLQRQSADQPIRGSPTAFR